MRNIIAVLISVSLLMCLSAVATAAYVYKWTDEEGNVHFSDKPVGENVELHQVKTQKGIKGVESHKQIIESQKNNNENKAGKEGTEQAQGQTQGQEGGEQQGEMTKEQIAQRKENCERLKKNLKSYETTPRLYREDDKGERVYLSESEKEKAIEKTRKNMKEWCD